MHHMNSDNIVSDTVSVLSEKSPLARLQHRVAIASVQLLVYPRTSGLWVVIQSLCSA